MDTAAQGEAYAGIACNIAHDLWNNRARHAFSSWFPLQTSAPHFLAGLWMWHGQG